MKDTIRGESAGKPGSKKFFEKIDTELFPTSARKRGDRRPSAKSRPSAVRGEMDPFL